MITKVEVISKKLTLGEELVVITKKEFNRIQKRMWELTDALAKISRGEKELKEKKTKIVPSLSQLLKWMEITTVHITSDFTKSFKKLPRNIQERAENKDRLFREEPFQPSLKTHALRGALEGYLSYSINFHYRVLFKFLGQQTVIYYDIGTHEIYKTSWL